ncbi:MAG: S41 family peptidase [Candidatus Taylorbacteria bacterium]|nr:S41 family peptidase [Candidatus Taylorbacteria bacterium]
MHNSEQNKTLISIGLVIVLIAVFSFGFISGKSQTAEASKMQAISESLNGTKDKPNQVDFALFWKVWNTVNEKYVATHGTTTPSDTDRVYGAIKGMVDAMGDPYTTFFPPQAASVFESEIEGNFEGVGIEMGIKDKTLTVISALKNSPAERAGIKSGDKIIRIDQNSTEGMTIEAAIQKIRGKKGTIVEFSVFREGQKDLLDIKITRDVIVLPTIDTNYDKQTNIFTIRLYNFSAQSPGLFRNALRDFVNSKSNKLILDLRGNPGGYLDAAVDMASWFLPPGKVIVRESFGGNKPEVIERSHGYNIFNDNLKMVVLVDGGSASASEILAGALQEHGRATLVGSKTFGKGSVQEYIKVTDNTALKVTIARWLTPNGKSISDGGLTPDHVVDLTPENVKAGQDLQLQKAIEVLSK